MNGMVTIIAALAAWAFFCDPITAQSANNADDTGRAAADWYSPCDEGSDVCEISRFLSERPIIMVQELDEGGMVMAILGLEAGRLREELPIAALPEAPFGMVAFEHQGRTFLISKSTVDLDGYSRGEICVRSERERVRIIRGARAVCDD